MIHEQEMQEYPRGREWECIPCKKRYPEDFEPDHCEVCGGILVRVLAEVPLNGPEQQEIADGMLRWEPGTLSTRTVERILMDALADVWTDCYRRDIGSQQNLFREKVMSAISAATGHSMKVTL